MHLLAKGGSCWGQAGGKVLAERMPVHGPGLAGGKKRSEPTGGAAYGIPRKASTFLLLVPPTNLRYTPVSNMEQCMAELNWVSYVLSIDHAFVKASQKRLF